MQPVEKHKKDLISLEIIMLFNMTFENVGFSLKRNSIQELSHCLRIIRDNNVGRLSNKISH
jgi:hypothetical protein